MRRLPWGLPKPWSEKPTLPLLGDRGPTSLAVRPASRGNGPHAAKIGWGALRCTGTQVQCCQVTSHFKISQNFRLSVKSNVRPNIPKKKP